MDFPSNSHSSKQAKERPVIEKVVASEVAVRPKSIGSRLKHIFFGGDFRGASGYVITDVILPQIKNMIVDATSKGVERMIYGDSGRRRPSSGYNAPQVSYNRVGSSWPMRDPRGSSVSLPHQPPYSRQQTRESEELIFQTRDDAEAVLEKLSDVADQYDNVSVADLKEMVGLPSSYVDNDWGWRTVKNSDIRQIREGYLLILPPKEPIK